MVMLEKVSDSDRLLCDNEYITSRLIAMMMNNVQQDSTNVQHACIEHHCFFAVNINDMLYQYCTKTATTLVIINKACEAYHSCARAQGGEIKHLLIHCEHCHTEVTPRQNIQRIDFKKNFTLNFLPQIDYRMIMRTVVAIK